VLFLSNSRAPSRLRTPVSYLAQKTWPILPARLGQQLSKLGIPYLPSPMMTPLAYLEQKGVLDLKPLLVHMVEVTDDDIERVRRSGATVIHCPRSNQRLQCGRMPLEKYINAAVPVLLGSDSRTSSPSLDVAAPKKAHLPKPFMQASCHHTSLIA
jgi:hypothetical protein